MTNQLRLPVMRSDQRLNPRFFPQVVQGGLQRELGGVRLHAVGLTCDRAWCRPWARARQAEPEPQDGYAGISILLDRAANHLAKAGQLRGSRIGLAPGIILGAGAGHALGDELAGDLRDVHRSRRFAAQTERPDPPRMRVGQCRRQLRIVGAEGGCTNLEASRHHGVCSVRQHGQGKQVRNGSHRALVERGCRGSSAAFRRAILC
jgi:hypothetical protein